MASPAPSRRSHPAALKDDIISKSRSGTPLRAMAPIAKDDPLQPLRAMADRVGREVEKFAERVDYWQNSKRPAQGYNAAVEYYETLSLVDRFKADAESRVKELKKQSGVENQGELQKSTRRRIQDMAASTREDDDDFYSRSVVPSIEGSTIPNSTRVQELRHWQNEAATWDLLRNIVAHYHPQPGVDAAAEKRSKLAKVGGAYRYSPNQEIWNRFLLEDDEAKEKELILRWLERTATNTESDIESIIEQLEDESGKGTDTWTSGFIDTKAQIKQAKRLQQTDKPLGPDYAGLKTKDKSKLLVTQLDPDAPGRQKRSLERPDEFYDRALWMVCYEMLRRGTSWQEVSNWCKERSEAWRAFSIGAACESNPDGGPNISGPTVGYLFRRMCFYAAKGAKTPFESAVYGLLSGDLKEVLPVCRSWEDHLYAHYNALLLSRFDGYLLRNHSNKISQSIVQRFAFQDAVANMGNWKNSSQEVVNLLKRQKSTTAMSLAPMKLVQGSLIGRTIQELLLNVGYAIAALFKLDNRPTCLITDPENVGQSSAGQSSSMMRQMSTDKHHEELATNPDALRVLVHISIVLGPGLHTFTARNVHYITAMDNVVAAYIEFLRLTRRFQLIPLYAAQLYADRPVACMARILPDIKNNDEQKNIVRLMKEYGIPSHKVIKQNYVLVSERLYRDNTKRISKFELLEHTENPIFPGRRVRNLIPTLKIGPEEEAMLDALRWTLHLEKDFVVTFGILHSGLLYFLQAGHLAAAIQLVTEMSVDIISEIKTQALCGYSFNFSDQYAHIQDPTRALSSPGRATVQGPIPSAQEHQNIVFHLRMQSEVYYELQQLVSLIQWFSQWREEEDKIIKQQKQQPGIKINTKRIREIFHYIESTIEVLCESFIEQIDNTPDSDAMRVKHIYIPEIIIAYISVVQSMAVFTSREITTKAMDIATVIADSERVWLQNVFMETGRMGELVDMLALTSKAMLTMVEDGGKSRRDGGKKRGSKGETNRIWDLNVRN